MEMNCVEKDFKTKVETHFPGRRVTIGRTANLTAPVKGRGLCQYRNLCHRGCPYGAYFSTNASTLPAAFLTGRLTLMSRVLVNRVIYEEKTQKAKAVEVIHTDDGRVEEFFARLFFINASTLATAFILLNSTTSRFPNGLGNGSDQIGRNLMDHHKSPGIYGSIEGYEEEYYFGRRPNGIYIPRFRNITEKRKDYIRGFGCQAGASRQSWGGHDHDSAIGTTLKEALEEPGKWSMGFTGFGECLPYPENRIVLNKDKKDHFGRNTLSVDAAFRENEKSMQGDMVQAISEMLESSGFKNIRVEGRMSFPGNSNHEMGTARMGRNPKTSVVNHVNQMHEVRNVFITDGSCMASTGSVNPSLTYMALTARAADFAVGELKRNNI